MSLLLLSPMKTFRNVIATVLIVLLCSIPKGAPGQQITGTYSTSAPEATLFFLNPGYINPALGSGVLGMMSNPAGLRSVKKRQFTLAIGSPQSSKGSFDVRLIDSTRIYLPTKVDTKLELNEVGGLGAIGYAQQNGPWTWGISMLQARKGGLSLAAHGEIDASTQFEMEEPITRDMYDDLPVDELPVTWDVASQLLLTLDSQPAEISVSILPICAGVAVEKGIFALGAGLTYFRLSSSDDMGTLSARVSGQSTIQGTPTGLDPQSQSPWKGNISAHLSIDDQPLVAQYKFNISGNRLAVSFGGVMNWGILSLGGSFSHGFKADINGDYDIQSIVTTGLPEGTEFENITLDFSQSPEIGGHVDLDLSSFEKDTLRVADSGDLRIGGYNSIMVGMSFLGIGAFVGGEIPQTYPDMLSTYFGVNIDWPLPWLPLRVNAGFISRSDAFAMNEETIVPFRTANHIGLGCAVKVPLHKWLKLGDDPSWFRVGARSSLTSMALATIESRTRETKEKDLPNVIETSALSFGLEVPF